MNVPNLLLIAGTGNKSGKTSMACRVIEQFCHLKPVGIKITPHVHETTEGLVTIVEEDGYSVFEETDRNMLKDTSRMLRAGAARVFCAKVNDDALPDAFDDIMEHVPFNAPIICESPALRRYLIPGLFIIMDSRNVNKHKDISHLLEIPHVMFDLEDMESTSPLPIDFRDGKWLYKE
jgi:hypothetical protein